MRRAVVGDNVAGSYFNHYEGAAAPQNRKGCG
jgi:hypothetical protein